MTYKEAFVAVVKCGGRILREDGDKVLLPFGADYELMLKNMHARRAVVSVSVDGQDVLSGRQIVVNPNSETTLQGIMDASGHVQSMFRFIQKTKEISEHRGDRIDDGMIRIKFQFEEAPQQFPWDEPLMRRIPIGGDASPFGSSRGFGSPMKGLTVNNVTYGQNAESNVTLDWMGSEPERSDVPRSDEGITVAGADTHQRFQSTYVGALESESHVIILQLKGSSGGTVVQKPVTVKTKITCPSCGRKLKATTKFCPNCGTGLKAVA